MSKKIAVISILLSVLMLVSCSGGNKYGLAYTSDGTDRIEYIYYTDEQVVYVVGGMMMAEINGSSKMLEMAFNDGDLTISDIIAAAEADVEAKKIEVTEFPDGSREYHYDGFDIIKLNTYEGNRDIYFTPSSMGYYDVTN